MEICLRRATLRYPRQVIALRSLSIVFAIVLVTSACTDEDVNYSEIAAEATVASYETTSCSTSVVIGLSRQIADEVNCMMPGQLERFDASPNLVFSSSAVLPYLDPAAIVNLKKVSATTQIRINSAFRTVVQQYLLRAWLDRGRCGITAAAQPGRSNHESGRALDIANYSAVRSKMRANGWVDVVAGDPVHFDHSTSPDIRGADVQAFQRLWNRNNPADLIAEDGDYGAQTAARIRKSPGEGFAKGAVCGGPPPPPTDPGEPPPVDENDNEGGDTGSTAEGGCNSAGGGAGVVTTALVLFAFSLFSTRRRKSAKLFSVLSP
jgi:uncharacterized protein (TIGR03382 family)